MKLRYSPGLPENFSGRSIRGVKADTETDVGGITVGGIITDGAGESRGSTGFEVDDTGAEVSERRA